MCGGFEIEKKKVIEVQLKLVPSDESFWLVSFVIFWFSLAMFA